MTDETSINDGGPAFPNNDQHGCAYSGMTLRDWFAGQETLADYDHPDSWDNYAKTLRSFNGEYPDTKDNLAICIWEFEARAKMKLARADAMIKAREEA